MKRVLLGLAASLAFTVSVAASSFGPVPANYESAAESYISERLADARSAKYEVVSDPYMVYADIAGTLRTAPNLDAATALKWFGSPVIAA